jgi:hypothetical protein
MSDADNAFAELLNSELSADTLAALRAFQADGTTNDEDWQLSQFWYNESTSQTLCDAVVEAAELVDVKEPVVMFVSAPTAYQAAVKRQDLEHTRLLCAEYDTKFRAIAGEENFVFYDYSNPLDMPKEFEHAVDVLLIDPPFLSQECVEKFMETSRLLSHEHTKIIFASGFQVDVHVRAHGKDMRRCDFQPEHEGGLANVFATWTNYESAVLGTAALDD